MSMEVPSSVRLVRDFVNSAEPQLGTDQLASPEARACLERLGLLPPGAAVSDRDLALLITVREGLREVLLGHAGHQQRASVLADLDDALRTVAVTTSLSGTPALNAVGSDPGRRAVAAILTAVLTAPREEWTRLKVCARDSCRWAFVDSSRNRSGRWCSMAGCGNIVKMRRAHRARSETTR